MDRFKCQTCNTWKSNNQIGEGKNARGHGLTRCKSCMENKKDGNTDLAKTIQVDEELEREWIHGQCENKLCYSVDKVTQVNGKYLCGDCLSEWESHKDYWIVPAEEKRTPLDPGEERLLYMTEFGDKLQAEKN